MLSGFWLRTPALLRSAGFVPLLGSGANSVLNGLFPLNREHKTNDNRFLKALCAQTVINKQPSTGNPFAALTLWLGVWELLQGMDLEELILSQGDKLEVVFACGGFAPPHQLPGVY